ncbi:UNVERIFIED_CONTAM: Lysophospholipid acyltransferase LPEAT2, partial [Sesamum indicum]
YHWIKRRGKPAPREIAPIVVSNHVSYIEPIFFFYELFPTIVSSESHDSMPFVGTIIRAMQVIYVDRFSRSSRKHAVNEIKRKASCNQFPRVLLFPEGTTSNGRVIISFQLGAFIPGYPVQPVVVRYPYVHFDQSWGNIALAKLMFRMFTQFHNFMEGLCLFFILACWITIELLMTMVLCNTSLVVDCSNIEYLPLVSPHENRKENAHHFAQRVKFFRLIVQGYEIMIALSLKFYVSSSISILSKSREKKLRRVRISSLEKGLEVQFLSYSDFGEDESCICIDVVHSMFISGFTGHVIASALNVAQTSHSYGDFMLLARAAESKQENPSLYMVEMAWVQSNLHLRVLEAIEFLEIFLSMNPDRSGHVEFHDFLRALKLKPCGLSEKMFGFIDVQKIGKITFKQFLLGSAHILKQPLFHHACELAFSECDMNGKNYILKQELQDAVSLTVPNLNYDEIHGPFSLFDMDNDGKISKDDFISCLRRHPLLIALFAPKLLQRSSSIATQSLVQEVF